MRDAEVFVEEHSLKGNIFTYNGKDYTLGRIWRVLGNKRLYIELINGGMYLNVPLHEVSKQLFNEGPHSIS